MHASSIPATIHAKFAKTGTPSPRISALAPTLRVWAARLDPAEDTTDPSEEEEGCSSFGVQAQGVFKHGSATEAGSAEATDDARDCQPPTRRWYDPYEAHVLEHGGKVEAVGISEHGVVLSGSYEPDELRVWTPDLGTY